MKIPQYITTYRAIVVAITLVIVGWLLIGDLVGPLPALLKGI
jgi:hypothetical protein